MTKNLNLNRNLTPFSRFRWWVRLTVGDPGFGPERRLSAGFAFAHVQMMSLLEKFAPALAPRLKPVEDRRSFRLSPPIGARIAQIAQNAPDHVKPASNPQTGLSVPLQRIAARLKLQCNPVFQVHQPSTLNPQPTDA